MVAPSKELLSELKANAPRRACDKISCNHIERGSSVGFPSLVVDDALGKVGVLLTELSA